MKGVVARGKQHIFLIVKVCSCQVKMPGLTPIQTNVYYLGMIVYSKKWLLEQVIEDSDDKRMILLSIIKQVFDSQVYKGPRCDATDCATKGKCPRNRKLSIMLLERASMATAEKEFASIMLHAYKTGDDLEEAVFTKHIAPSGNPIKIEFSAVGVLKESGDQSGVQMQNMLKGEFSELEDAVMIAEMKDLMKKAVTDECQANVIVLRTEGYEEQ